MNDPRDREVAIFGAALQLPASQRAAYLDEACAGDDLLRRRVEAFIADHDESGAFLAEPPPGAERLASLLGDQGDLANATIRSEMPGDWIGRYKLLQQIGVGGCGVVYMAEQQEPIRRMVALKVIKLGMDTKSVVNRFDAERQALAMMDHPCIARVLDAGATEAGRPYFVMELVRGVKITEFCDQNRFDTRQRLHLFIQVCQAIQHAHQKGVIHRDIKPSNILVTINDGQAIPKVIDFGIAKAMLGRLTDRTLFTEFDKFLGTPAYMSPEQAAMTSLDIDTRSDIYSLGVLLYEILTGNTPFDTRELLKEGFDEMRRTIRESEPERPSARLERIPIVALTELADRRHTDIPKLKQSLLRDLDWIVMKALEKDRSRRYETASGLARDVQRYLANEAVSARPPSKPYRFRKWVQRHKFAFASGFVLAVSLVSALLVSTMAAFRIRLAKDDATEKLRESYLAEAQALRSGSRASQRSSTLDAVRKAAAIRPDFSVRNEAIAAFALSDIREDKRVTLSGYSRNELVPVDFNAERCAAANVAGDVLIQSVSNKTTLAVLAAPGFVLETIESFSPNSRYLLARYWHDRVGPSPARQFECVWDTLQSKMMLKIPQQSISKPVLNFEFGTAFDVDSRLFVSSHPSGTVTIHDIASGVQLHEIGVGRRVNRVALDGQKRKLACSRSDGTTVEIYDVNSGELTSTLSCPEFVDEIAWSPDGNLLAAGCADFNIYVWEVATGHKRANLAGASARITSLVFNHQGNLLAGASFDGDIRLWDPNDGRLLANYPGGSWGLQFSADDEHLLGWHQFARFGTLQVTHSRECRLLYVPRDGGDITGPDFSPDGRLLAAGTVYRTRMWDAASGKQLAVLPIENCDTHVFHPSGTNVVTIDRSNGVRFWSIERVESPVGVAYRLGHARKVFPVSQLRDGALSLDGRHLAVTHEYESESFVLDLAEPSAKPVVLKPHPSVNRIAISPDGRWVATASIHNDIVKVWDARTGDMIRTLPTPGRTRVVFSPNGRWLATSSSEYQLWEVGSWQPKGPPIPGYEMPDWNCAVFSPDSSIIAITTSGHSIELLDTLSETPLAILEAPVSSGVHKIQFSPDGTQIAGLQRDQQVQLWDLRMVRKELKEMGLDWDRPAYPNPSTPTLQLPVTLEIEPASLKPQNAP